MADVWQQHIPMSARPGCLQNGDPQDHPESCVFEPTTTNELRSISIAERYENPVIHGTAPPVVAGRGIVQHPTTVVAARVARR
jgi:hypothetical protein